MFTVRQGHAINVSMFQFNFVSLDFVVSKLFYFDLFLSGSEIGRFVTMLRNPSSILKACAAFALLQVTVLSLGFLCPIPVYLE